MCLWLLEQIPRSRIIEAKDQNTLRLLMILKVILKMILNNNHGDCAKLVSESL